MGALYGYGGAPRMQPPPKIIPRPLYTRHARVYNKRNPPIFHALREAGMEIQEGPVNGFSKRDYCLGISGFSRVRRFMNSSPVMVSFL